ncbi:MAG: response regulator [Bacteriovoracaceae bacterium]|nr:response regulator [Bacteriovoracaceae bacterium]
MGKMAENSGFLCAEDDATMRANLIKDLRGLGFTGQIYEAENGEAAFKVLKDKAADIKFIISDLMMPGTNGIEFLKLARAEAAFKNVPFLLLTSENDRNTVVSAVQSGASNYLLKPWTKQSLAEKIVFCWDKHNK